MRTLSMYYSIISTPFGCSAIIFTKSPFVLRKVLLPCKSKDDLCNIGIADDYYKAQIISKLIKDYFLGISIKVPWELLDFDRMTLFERTVLYATADIQFGQVQTYKDIAEAVGSPKAYRAVGNSLAKNPFPIIIPCHRIIKSNGSIGNFVGGTDMKGKMIALEDKVAPNLV
mmetsp:Transcript_23710/g.11422  ORF Transcript_23710/g.11422 Transcript_23710/m.11422 type:complete len:171 (-) Transcript_23710:1033-1545(-)